MPLVSGIEESSPEGRRIGARRSEIFRTGWLPGLRPFPGTRDLLMRFLDDGFTLAVASSAKEEELGPLLDAAGVRDLVGAKTSSDDAEASKPDPDIITAALEKIGAAADRAIMLGDTPYDVEAARRAGVRIVAFECGGWTGADLRADEVYEGAADLLRRYGASMFARQATAGSLPSSAGRGGASPPPGTS